MSSEEFYQSLENIVMSVFPFRAGNGYNLMDIRGSGMYMYNEISKNLETELFPSQIYNLKNQLHSIIEKLVIVNNTCLLQHPVVIPTFDRYTVINNIGELFLYMRRELPKCIILRKANKPDETFYVSRDYILDQNYKPLFLITYNCQLVIPTGQVASCIKTTGVNIYIDKSIYSDTSSEFSKLITKKVIPFYTSLKITALNLIDHTPRTSLNLVVVENSVTWEFPHDIIVTDLSNYIGKLYGGIPYNLDEVCGCAFKNVAPSMVGFQSLNV